MIFTTSFLVTVLSAVATLWHYGKEGNDRKFVLSSICVGNEKPAPSEQWIRVNMLYGFGCDFFFSLFFNVVWILSFQIVSDKH